MDTFTSMLFNWDLSWCLHDHWSSSLMLSLWLSLMLRPIRMGSQDSVQELLGTGLILGDVLLTKRQKRWVFETEDDESARLLQIGQLLFKTNAESSSWRIVLV
ncbi:hypothetical protein CFP56_015330 [Quercus suber]|uniref:Uncharacterized protein n=1 Tax=Quercus suber TaxID=58331 RepID=A0AAW0KS13_QUESU